MLLGKTVRKAVIRTLTAEEAVIFFALAESADKSAQGTIDMCRLLNDTRIGIIKLRKNIVSRISKKAIEITFKDCKGKGKEKTVKEYKICIDRDYWTDRDKSIEPIRL